jgi:hypothetical protein
LEKNGDQWLKEQDDSREARLDRLRAEVDIDLVRIKNGQYTTFDVDNSQPLIDEIRAEGLKRMAKRIEERSR